MKLKVQEICDSIEKVKEMRRELLVLEAVLNSDSKLHDKVFVENASHGDVVLCDGMLTGVYTILKEYQALLEGIKSEATVEFTVRSKEEIFC